MGPQERPALPVSSLLDQTFPSYLLNKIIYLCNDFFGLFIYVLFCCMTLMMILPCWKTEFYGESTFSFKNHDSFHRRYIVQEGGGSLFFTMWAH